MSRILINNYSTISDEKALHLVSKIVEKGRISNKNKQYCYLTHFENDEFSVDISTKLNSGSDSFIVIDSPKHEK